MATVPNNSLFSCSPFQSSDHTDSTCSTSDHLPTYIDELKLPSGINTKEPLYLASGAHGASPQIVFDQIKIRRDGNKNQMASLQHERADHNTLTLPAAPAPNGVPLPSFSNASTCAGSIAPNQWQGYPPPNDEVATKVDMGVQIDANGVMTAVRGQVYASSDVIARDADSLADASDCPPPPSILSQDVSYSALDGDVCPSVGSIGHPWACAEACKYFKKSWGCYWGKNCHNCHLCTRHHLSKWRRPNSAAVDDNNSEGTDIMFDMNDVAVDTQELEFLGLYAAQSKSLGSVGHPFRCGPACRYTWRKAGCKNGNGCLCCHLCRWSRLP